MKNKRKNQKSEFKKNNDCLKSLAKETKEILQKNNIKLNRNLGQNYLIDDFKRKKILEFGNLDKNDIILEIGPGIGTLTLEIAKKVKKIIAIEQDKDIFKILKKRIKDAAISNIELINDDALNVDFPKFNKIVSNLPYQISSPITFKFLEYDFDLAILMYQKEFAKRMLASVGEKDYSRLSAMLYFKMNLELLDEVSPESFIPKPKIYSSVVKLVPLKNNDKMKTNINGWREHFNESLINEEYSIICRALFQHKNKKIKNALVDSRHVLGYSDKKELKNNLKELSNENTELTSFLTKRTIATSPEEILKLTYYLKNIIKINTTKNKNI